ncbi:MAG: PQQ-binding-like beta-propeller repeat protein [Acidobacteriota bacterium]
MRPAFALALAVLLLPPAAWPQTPEPSFSRNCAGCHGEGATGTDRGPSFINSRSLRRRSEDQILNLIRNGTPGGMPAFALPEEELRSLARFVRTFNASAFEVRPAGDVAAGESFFFGQGQCATCHMVHGRGKTNGPDLSGAGRELTPRDLEQTLADPTSRLGIHSGASCPGWAFCPDEPWAVVNVRLRDGSALRGFARAQGKHDLQLQTPDGRLHLLTDAEYVQVTREKTSAMPPLRATEGERRDLIAYLASLGGIPAGPLQTETAPVAPREIEAILHPAAAEWPTYNGTVGGNRHSPLAQITAANAGKLQLQWSWSNPYQGLETTPLVSEGVLYVTAPNEVCALDARAGRQIWCYSRPRNSAATIAGDAAKGANRGAALLGDRVFFATDDAHLICLNRITGSLMWDVDVREGPGAMGSTGAPLVVGDLVITGIAGGDAPLRGYITAYQATTGQQVWRFFTVPKRGQPGSETWTKAGQTDAIAVGGGATWTTGSYDAETGILYWPTGNPYPDTDGDERAGDNLYTNCVLALDAKTGKLRWHYQFTPHDLHDWDATEPMVLVDTRFNGRDRKLLLHADRNGFFYVLDRITGELLLGKPFVRKLTWASGIGADGRPQLLAGNRPTKAGIKTCPAVRGATNWYSTAFDPATRLFYVMAVEDCSIYQQTKAGGFEPYRDPADPAEKFLRAIDIETGKVVWETLQIGPPESNYSGVLSTAGGLVFYGETGGSFAAVDAKDGRTLWHFNTGQQWKASPITYMAGGKQYVAIAAGGNLFAFALAP